MIPLATTTITWLASDQDGTKDLRDPPTFSIPRASGVRAVIGSPGGTEDTTSGQREETTFRLNCDPVPGALHDERVVDEQTDETYEVVWVRQRRGLGLDHTVAELRQITDEVSV